MNFIFVINYREAKFVLWVWLLTVASAEQIQCEKKEIQFFHIRGIGDQQTCWMRTSKIDSNDTTIEADEAITALEFEVNKDILFLPVGVGISFPHLIQYSANGCSVKTIVKDNFQGLSELVILFLQYNKLETVNSDTFEGLISLRYLFMSMQGIGFF